MLKQKIHLKERKNIKGRVYGVVIMLIIITITITINLISKKITPVLFEMAELEINKISTLVVNNVISETLEKEKTINNIITPTLSNDGTIQMIDFNSVIVNKILSKSTINIQKKLKSIEKGNIKEILYNDNNKKGVIMKIPMGSAFKNVFFSNLGPKIPVRLHYFGDINSNIKTKLTPYGINNALIEVIVSIDIKAKVIFPFISRVIKINCDVPLIIKMIQGKVPSYYGGELLKNSSMYSIPME